MGYKVYYNGSSSSLVYYDIVLVKKKPGILGLETLENYLSTYDVSEIKEGKLRIEESSLSTFFLYDTNPEKVMTYDLLLYVTEPVNFDGSGVPANEQKCIGYISLNEIGLADPRTNELIKIVYNVIEPDEFDVVLVNDYTESELEITDYVKDYNNSNIFTYSKEAINKMVFKPRVYSTKEALTNNLGIAPTFTGFLTDGKYYETPFMNVNLWRDSTVVTDIRQMYYKGTQFIKVDYSDKHTVFFLQNDLAETRERGSIFDLPSTVIIDWSFAETAIVTPEDLCYKLGNFWYKTKSYYPREQMLNILYHERLLPNLLPGLVIGNLKSQITYSDTNKSGSDWCLKSEVNTLLDNMNIVGVNGTWANSSLIKYQLIETDMQTIILKEFNSNIEDYVVYFPDGTKLRRPTSDQLKLVGNGELHLKTSKGVRIFLESANNYKDIYTDEDLFLHYFGNTNKVISLRRVFFDNLLILNGSYFLINNNLLQ